MPGRELIQVEQGDGSYAWLDKHGGEIVGQPRRANLTKDMLYEAEPMLAQKLMRNEALSWYELGKCIDVMTRAVTGEAIKKLMTAQTIGEMQRMLKVMVQAKMTCELLNPLGASPDMNATRTEAQRAASKMLTLPQ